MVLKVAMETIHSDIWRLFQKNIRKGRHSSCNDDLRQRATNEMDVSESLSPIDLLSRNRFPSEPWRRPLSSPKSLDPGGQEC